MLQVPIHGILVVYTLTMLYITYNKHIGKSLCPTQVFKYLDNYQLLAPVNNICHEVIFHLATAKASIQRIFEILQKPSS